MTIERILSWLLVLTPLVILGMSLRMILTRKRGPAPPPGADDAD
jgi:quinol-cytochrome oxidoreductase complex cytochrome b subunit